MIFTKVLGGLLAADVALVTATIALGHRKSDDGTNYNVAWIDGVDQCTADAWAGTCKAQTAYINRYPQDNPCDTPFGIDHDHQNYQVHGCGTNQLQLYQNGKWQSDCHALGDTKISCTPGPCHDVIHSYNCY